MLDVLDLEYIKLARAKGVNATMVKLSPSSLPPRF